MSKWNIIKDNLKDVKMALDNTMIDEKLKGTLSLKLIIIVIISVLILIGVLAYVSKRFGNLFKSKKKPIVFYKNGKSTDMFDIISDSKSRLTLNNELSISLFIKIDEWYENFNKWKHVLHKGTSIDSTKYIKWDTPKYQHPGIWLTPKINNLRVVLTTYDEYKFKKIYVDIDNVPIGRYFHIVVTIDKDLISVFLDGRLVKNRIIKGIPMLTVGNTYVNPTFTYKGFIKSLQFFNRVISVEEINAILEDVNKEELKKQKKIIVENKKQKKARRKERIQEAIAYKPREQSEPVQCHPFRKLLIEKAK